MNWTDAEQHSYPIALMSDNHLLNAIMMMKRKGFVTTAEAGPMPEAAPLSERMEWASKATSPLFDALVMERFGRLAEGVVLDEDRAKELREDYLQEQWQTRARSQMRYKPERAQPLRNIAPRGPYDQHPGFDNDDGI